MNTTVILLSGKSGSGKDYVANIMKTQLEQNNNKVLITHYADLLKYICKTFFNWNGEKDEKGRTLLQHVGTDVIRAEDPDYWVNFITEIIIRFSNKWDYIIIPDTRFKNEIEYITRLENLDTFTVKSVRVERPNYESILTKEQQLHPSETELDNYKFDYTITNDDYVENDIKNFFVCCLGVYVDKEGSIFVDFDCTLANTIKAIVDLYDEDYKYYSDYKKIPWQEVTSWNFTELSLAKPEIINLYFNQQRFFDRVELFPHAKEVLEELSKKYKIVIVSHGYSPNLRAKEKFCNEQFPFADFIGVNLKEHSDKSCVDMEGGYFIDDRADNLESSNATMKICFGRVYDWNDFWDADLDTKYNALTWENVKGILE